MRGWRLQVSAQVVLWWGSLAALHVLRRIFAYHYHRLLGALGWALPWPTEAVGLPLLGGGFYAPQPHSALFYLYWGVLALAPAALALWSSRAGDAPAAQRRWSGALMTFLLAALLTTLIWALTLALPFLPIHTAVG